MKQSNNKGMCSNLEVPTHILFEGEFTTKQHAISQLPFKLYVVTKSSLYSIVDTGNIEIKPVSSGH